MRYYRKLKRTLKNYISLFFLIILAFYLFQSPYFTKNFIQGGLSYLSSLYAKYQIQVSLIGCIIVLIIVVKLIFRFKWFKWLFRTPVHLLAGLIKSAVSAVLSKIQKIQENTRKRELLSCDMVEVDEMEGTEFEDFLEVLFRKKGYRVRTTATTGDYGADLILNNHIVVQAKRYAGSIGVKAVQEVIGAKGFYQADEGMVVTNSYFTPNAVNLAKANHIELWDRERLMKEIKSTKDKGDNNAGVSD